MDVCMRAHTIVTPFINCVHNVLIIQSSMMHAYACCICTLYMFLLTLAKEPYFSDDRPSLHLTL